MVVLPIFTSFLIYTVGKWALMQPKHQDDANGVGLVAHENPAMYNINVSYNI
jgi:hypothetical protein